MKKKKLNKAEYGYDFDPRKIYDQYYGNALPEQQVTAKRNDQYLPQSPYHNLPVDVSPTVNINSSNLGSNYPTDNNQNQGEQQNKGFNKVGQGLMWGAKQAGQFLHDFTNTALPLAASLIPDNANQWNKRPVQNAYYNPYIYGTGSQAIYADGGNVSPYQTTSRRQHNIQITEDTPIQPYSAQDHIPQAYEAPIPLQPIAPQKKALTYEQIASPNGVTQMSPVFGGPWSYNDVQNYWNNVPSTINNQPVIKGQAWQDLWQGFQPGSNANQWRPTNYTQGVTNAMYNVFDYGGFISDKDYQAANNTLPLNEYDYGGFISNNDYRVEEDPNLYPESDITKYLKAKSGIHIKPENRGKFTEYKKRTGKTTEEALHSKDPHVRQMANFARNAKKWKHEDGGSIPYMQEGQEVELTPEQLAYYKSKGFDFE